MRARAWQGWGLVELQGWWSRVACSGSWLVLQGDFECVWEDLEWEGWTTGWALFAELQPVDNNQGEWLRETETWRGDDVGNQHGVTCPTSWKFNIGQISTNPALCSILTCCNSSFCSQLPPTPILLCLHLAFTDPLQHFTTQLLLSSRGSRPVKTNHMEWLSAKSQLHPHVK